MRLFKIRISRVSASLLMPLLMASISLLPSRLAAQACTGGLQSSTQTVTLAGTGGNVFAPTFSQYNPPAGYVLVSAAVKTTVSISGSVGLTNNTASDQFIIVGAADDDELTINGSVIPNGSGGSSTGETPYSNFPPTTVPANSSQTLGPSTLSSNQTVQYDTITNSESVLNDFIGTGSPSIGYYNYIFLQQSNTNVGVAASLSASIKISLTYYYCYTGPLAANFLTFTAVLENPQTVLLNWLTTNETLGEKYVVQVSSGNGTDFSNVDTVLADGVAGNGNYAYNYMVQPTDKGNLYFRLQLIEPGGTTSYSPLRVVALDNGSGSAFSIYPNPPSTFINLTFPGNSRDWQVQIFAADGDLVQQNYFSNTNLATMNFNHKMAAGAYFVRAINPQTSDHYAGSFVIRD
jgi:Secretion system C-terminal sorting domain